MVRKGLLFVPLVLLMGGITACGTTSGGGPTSNQTSSTGSTTNNAGTSNSTSQKVVLNFPTWQATDPSFAPWWKGLIKAYETQHPNVTINMTYVPFKSYVNTLTTEFSSNQPPDIAHIVSADFSQFANQGWLAPLDSYLPSSDISSTWTPLQKSMNWNGHTEGVLLLGYGYVLYYNQKLLQDAGVSVPTTPAEFIAAAGKLTGNGIYGYGATTTLNPNVFTNVGEFVTGEGQQWVKNGKYDLTSPGFVKAIDDYRSILKYSPHGLQPEQMRQLFFDGKIGMMIDGPFVYSSVSKAPKNIQPYIKVAAPPFSVFPGNISNNLSIPAGISNTKKQLVWDFIKLAASPEWQTKYANMTDSPPPRNGAVTPDVTKAHPEMQVASQVASKAVGILPNDSKILANYNEFSQVVDSAMMTMMTSKQSTTQILKSLQQQLDSQVQP